MNDNNEIEIVEETSVKRKGNNKIMYLLAIITALALVVAITATSYAYFTATVTNSGNVTSTDVTTARLELEFTDGPEVTLENAIPGSYLTKTFKVKNVGNKETTYDVYLSDLVNTASDKSDFVYTLTSNDGGYNVSTQTQIPAYPSKIVSNQAIAAGVAHNYTLRIDFLETNDNQDDNKGKTISTIIRVNEVHEAVVPHEGPTFDTNDFYSTANVKQKGAIGIAYLDPTNLNRTCNEANSSKGSGLTGCMRFYVFDDSDSKYKMILDHNTFNDLVWNESDRNVAYESSGAYSSNQVLISEYNWDSSLGPTVLTTAEVNAITGRENFDPTNFGDKTYYFDSLSAYQEATSQGASAYAWLYNYTDGCISNGCDYEDPNTNSYWLKEPRGPVNGGTDVRVINYEGRIYYYEAYHNYSGVRPVITVLQSVFE